MYNKLFELLLKNAYHAKTHWIRLKQNFCLHHLLEEEEILTLFDKIGHLIQFSQAEHSSFLWLLRFHLLWVSIGAARDMKIKYIINPRAASNSPM